MSTSGRPDERDAPPVRGRPAGMSCPFRQGHVTLALAGLGIGLAAWRVGPDRSRLVSPNFYLKQQV